MKPSILSAAALLGALSSCVSAVVTIPFAKDFEAPPLERRLNSRATITQSLVNNVTGGSYMAKVTIGGQPISLAIDTGSSDVWTIAKTADLCNSKALQTKYQTGGCNSVYDPMKSSNFKVVKQGAFDIAYADGSGAKGDYFTDNFGIGGSTVKNLEMGVAYNITISTGIMGIGYTLNEASNNARTQTSPFTYPSVIDQMVSQGLINIAAYSLYLDSLTDSSGSIIFGGMDTDKFVGTLFELPVVPSQYPNGTTTYAELAVEMTNFGSTDASGKTTNITSAQFDIPVVLDSGTTITYLPTTPASKLYTLLGAVDDSENSGNVFIDCTLRTKAPSTTVNYGFGSTAGVAELVIAVPITELIFDLSAAQVQAAAPSNLPFNSVCAFGVQSLGDEGPFILGDTFLRSAYVVYDLHNNKVAMAQTNFDSSKSNVVEFQASQTAIPLVSGAANSAGVTATTGLVGPKTSAGATVTLTSTAGAGVTSTTSKAAASLVVPPFNFDRLVVLGVSGLFAVLGGAWILL